MGSPAGISSSTDAAASTFASRSSSIRRSALICWAHYAPPISDMFRKSYRRLLRWNDEFPFAKFSVADDERPLLAVELPIEEADADALGLAIARILGIADRLLDESKDWLWIGGRMPDMGDRTSANGAFLDRYAARLPELLEPEVAVEPPESSVGRRGRARGARADPGARLVSRRLGILLLALVAATGLLADAGRHRRGPRRHAGPDDRRRTPATTSSPTQQRVRVTVDLVLTNHLRDTRHQALLLRPRLPGRPARLLRASS